MKKAIAGKEYLCIETVVMDNGKTLYIQGKKYKSEKDGCITNEENSPDHIWTKKCMKEFFREACGIETEPEYMITKSEMEELRYLLADDSHSGHHLRIEITKNILPHLFKDDKVELVPGNWYVYPAEPKFITYVKENGRRYGIGSAGNWFHDSDIVGDTRGYRLATPEEVTEALTKEAVKRYKVGDYLYLDHHKDEIKKLTLKEFKYYDKQNQLYAGAGENRMAKLFEKGIWTPTEETITKEDAEKQLNKKIID